MAQELFERVDRKVGNLLDDVMNGRIGLPDLQRPFVWADSKVRNLFDSMMKGFPIGYVMLWASPEDYHNTKSIGVGDKQFKRPDDLVIDGQQRLTSLFLLLKILESMKLGIKVERNLSFACREKSNYSLENIISLIEKKDYDEKKVDG